MKEIRPTDAEITPKQPLDERILGGIALTPFYDEEEIHTVVHRLNEVFDMLRQDTSREFGACIAYATSLCLEEEVALDEAIYETANRQNHGMVTVRNTILTGSQRSMWAGQDVVTGSKFLIAKQHLPILFNTGELEENGLIYSLNGRRGDDSNA